ncbi:MAG: UvrB/UvrC motif-containing protein [Acutalibacteraceae bacterium]
MLCQSCKKNQATTHVKSIVNGEFTEYHLCPECAKKMGYGSIFPSAGLDFSSFLGSFLDGGLPQRTSATRCKGCGASFSDIARTGKVGCADCYDNFYDELLPSIRKMHGNTTHTGKAPGGSSKELRVLNELERAKAELKIAIDKQEFEQAAKLRDKIKELEGGASK